MTKAFNIRTLVVLTMMAIAITVMVGSAFAKNNGDNTRPGWGYGDKNHEHTGPPGQSVRP